MNAENEQWNIADEEFNLWVNGNQQEKSIELTDILKSTFFIFRKKQLSWLEQFCNQSFDYLREKNYKTVDDFLYEQEIHFSLRRLSENETIEREKLKREEDNRIINGILSNDQKIFNSLYENEFPKIVRFIIRNSGNLENAKDVFQDALVLFIEKVYRKELDLKCSVNTYLYSICRYLWLEQLRKDKKSISLNDSYSSLQSDITFIGNDTAPDIFDNVIAAIESLGDPCKQLLECFYYQNLTWDEIASSLGYSNAASARNQKYKCLERIRIAVSYALE